MVPFKVSGTHDWDCGLKKDFFPLNILHTLCFSNFFFKNLSDIYFAALTYLMEL